MFTGMEKETTPISLQIGLLSSTTCCGYLRSCGEQVRLLVSELGWLTEANRNTFKLRLREPAQAEQISKHMQGRAAWYTRNATKCEEL